MSYYYNLSATNINLKLKLGDINGDGEVRSSDYTLFIRLILSSKIVSPPQLVPVGDLNNDRKVNTGDLTILQRYILDIITELPYKSVS